MRSGTCGRTFRCTFRRQTWYPFHVKINVVLFQPEIPQNTGNISRTCSVTGSALHLVHPVGFSLDERHLRRAGLDYWDTLEIFEYPDDEAFFRAHGDRRIWFFSQKGRLSIWQDDALTPDIPGSQAPDSGFVGFREPGAPRELGESRALGAPGETREPAQPEVWLAFGCESRGLDEKLLLQHDDTCVRIPMLDGKRSLNLSNAVAIAVYEVLRRYGGEGLKARGVLPGRADA